MKVGKYKIPYDKSGSLMHHATPDIPGYPTWGQAHEWRENLPFENILVLKDFCRGRSAAYFIWHELGNPEREFPMFMKDMVEFLKRGEIEAGTTKLHPPHTWQVVKRGQNYGITLVEPPAAHPDTSVALGA